MRKFWKKTLPFDISNEEQKATVKLQGGPTYHRLQLLTNATFAQIDRVRLTNHGVEKASWKGFQLQYMQQYLGSYIDSGTSRITIPFSENQCRTDEGIDYTELVTNTNDSWVLEVYFKNVASISIRGLAERSSAFQEVVNADGTVSLLNKVRTHIRRSQTLQMQAHALGENIYADFPAAEGRRIRRMFFECADIEKLVVVRDGIEQFDIDVADNIYIQKEAGRFPQDGMFCFDPLLHGFGKMDLFRTLSSDGELLFKVHIKHDAEKAPGVIPVFVDYIEIEQ